MERKSFEIGDKVAVLDDIITGRILKISPNQITIETTDGFPLNFVPTELVRIDTSISFKI